MKGFGKLLDVMELPELPHARAMLLRQIETTGAPERIVNAIAAVPRHAFVPASLSGAAYAANGTWLPSGAVLPAPAATARILSALEPRSTERVREIGTGSGYLSVVLAQLFREVVTLDTADRTDGILEMIGLDNIQRGEREGVFDAVLVGTPQPAFSPDLLGTARRAVVVIGQPFGRQRLLLARVRDADAEPELFDLGPVLLAASAFAGGAWPPSTSLPAMPTVLEGA